MFLKINVSCDSEGNEYGGEQFLPVESGEYALDSVFRLHFFRIIIDDFIDGSLCFRLMEGAIPHYFVLSGEGDSAHFSRQTPVLDEYFTFELTCKI